MNANESQPVAPVNKSTPASDLTKLRIRVAELCGWDWDENSCWNPIGQRHDRNPHPFANEPDGASLLPDYLNDLNACHSFRGLMNFSQRQQFIKHLRKITAPSERYELADSELIWATATDFCRAFVAVMEGRSVQGGNEKL